MLLSEGEIPNEEIFEESILPESRSEYQTLVKKIKKIKPNETASKEFKKLMKKRKIVSNAMLTVPIMTTTSTPSYVLHTEIPLNRSNEDSRCKFLGIKI